MMLPVAAPLYTDDAVTIWHGNALALPVPDESVDLIVTSPPYFGLRSYTDDGEHYEGQIGSEDSPQDFLDALVAATAEMVRVLKPSGSIWINLGDRYSGGTSGDRNNGFNERSGNASGRRAQEQSQTKVGAVPGMRPKSLIGIPWRYAIRCVDELGLILRAEVIWSKPNGLPESVTDRVRRSHEQWFHMVKEPRYFSAVDEIREEYAPATAARYTSGYNPSREAYAAGGPTKNGVARHDAGGPTSTNPLGKLPGSVWTIPTQPLNAPWGYGVEAGRIVRYFTGQRDALGWLRLSHRTRRRRIRALPDHFAAFPMEWPRRIIKGWSPSGICVECGDGRRPVVDRGRAEDRPGRVQGRAIDALLGGHGQDGRAGSRFTAVSTVTGYACACETPIAPTRPAVVLDPFGGTGTTALAAKALGRISWHVDLSADYCRLARWRVTDRDELARAMQVEKPPAEPVGMDSLLELLGDPAG